MILTLCPSPVLIVVRTELRLSGLDDLIPKNLERLVLIKPWSGLCSNPNDLPRFSGVVTFHFPRHLRLFRYRISMDVGDKRMRRMERNEWFEDIVTYGL